MEIRNKRVAILGASTNPERYANKTQKVLIEKGYNVYPINPNYKQIEEIVCYKKITNVTNDIDTLTVYMNPKKLELILPEIIIKKPKRIILNPCFESEEIKNKIKIENISVIEAGTLVLLKNGQF